MKVLCIPEIYTGEISWHFLSSLPPFCLSVELSGVWRENGAVHSHQIFRVDRPNRRTRDFVLFRGARRTWHVPPREDLHKLLANPAGQTEGPTDPKFAGHTYTASTCVLLWLPFLWGAGCTRQGRKTFLTWGPPMQGNFEPETPNSVGG